MRQWNRGGDAFFALVLHERGARTVRPRYSSTASGHGASARSSTEIPGLHRPASFKQNATAAVQGAQGRDLDGPDAASQRCRHGPEGVELIALRSQKSDALRKIELVRDVSSTRHCIARLVREAGHAMPLESEKETHEP